MIAISTSGNSPNINKAIVTAGKIGCATLALLGRDGGEAAGIADHKLIVPADQTPHIQEMHIAVIHLLCKMVEDALFPPEGEL